MLHLWSAAVGTRLDAVQGVLATLLPFPGALQYQLLVQDMHAEIKGAQAATAGSQ